MIEHFESRTSKDATKKTIDIYMDIRIPEKDLDKLLTFLRESQSISGFRVLDGTETPTKPSIF